MYTVHSISQALCIPFTVSPKHYVYRSQYFPSIMYTDVYGSQYFPSIMYTVHSISQALCIRFTIFHKYYHYVHRSPPPTPHPTPHPTPPHTHTLIFFRIRFFNTILYKGASDIQYCNKNSIWIISLLKYIYYYKRIFEMYSHIPFTPAPIFQIFQSICATPNFISWIRPGTVFSKHYVYIRFTVFSCDQAALWMVQSVRPSVRLSVCLSVCPSHLFDYVPIILSSWNFQELLPVTKVTSMQKVKVRGQRSRSQRSQPNFTVSGL